jgi:hypothetical protein
MVLCFHLDAHDWKENFFRLLCHYRHRHHHHQDGNPINCCDRMIDEKSEEIVERMFQEMIEELNYLVFVVCFRRVQ